MNDYATDTLQLTTVDGIDGWSIVSRLNHTFRTPLNHILGFAQILENQSFGALNERQTRYVTRIQTAGHRQLTMLDQLVDIARIHTGQFHPSETEWSMRSHLESIAEERRADMDTQSVRIALDVVTDEWVKGDYERFHLTVGNLGGQGRPGDAHGHHQAP